MAFGFFKKTQAADIIFTLPWIYDTATGRMLEWYDKLLLEQLFYPYGGDENVHSKVMNINSERGLELFLKFMLKIMLKNLIIVELI